MAVQPKLGLWRQRDRRVPLAPGDPGPVIQLVLRMPKKWIVVLVSAGLLLAACSTSQANTPEVQENPALENVLPPDVALNVQNQVSELLGVSVESLQIERVEKTEWPDSCLGLPGADESCAEGITPGWLLAFRVNDQEYRYRVDETGTVIRQEP